MKYITTIEDKAYEIEVNEEDEVLVDGERLAVEFQAVAEQAVYSLLLDNRSFEAHISPGQEGLDVLLRGQLYEVSVEDERQRLLRKAGGADIVQSGEYQLKAPMPGLIVDVPVNEGDEVSKGQNLVILESMKMQNELKSPRDGVIGRVRVKSGDSVKQNAVMLTLV
jgi:acetyl/propionyl-CoA carboxylase alpha subunit